MVQQMACQWMVAILASSIAIIGMLLLSPKKALSYRLDPGSIISYAVLAGRQTSLSFPKTLGATDTETMRKELSIYLNISSPLHADDDVYSPSISFKPIAPLIVRLISNILVHVSIAGFIAALEILLQKSVTQNGLGDVPDDTYLHYSWTIAPALLLALLALWLTSIDSQHRLLAPYTLLAHTCQGSTCLHMDWLRPIMPVVLLRQLRSRSFAAIGTTAAALLASVYTIPSASLFQVISVPVYDTLNLRMKDIFTANLNAPSDNNFIVSSLVLESNLSYTNRYYEDLVFPSITIESVFGGQNTSSNFSEASMVINGTIPALRPGLSCHLIRSSAITSSFKFNQKGRGNYDNNVTENGVMINITDRTCNSQTLFVPSYNNDSFSTTFATGGFFGAEDAMGYGCGTYLYIWGGFSSTNDSLSITTSAMTCNTTLEVADVDIYLKGPSLNLDLSQTPKAHESTARKVPYPLPGWTIYDSLASLPPPSNNTIFDQHFRLLTTSRYAVPFSFIGDPLHSEAVANAISFQHSIILAQLLSDSRISTDSKAKDQSLPEIPLALSYETTTGDPNVFPATATYPQGKRRLVQNPFSTRVLQSLLFASFVMSLLGWLFGHRKAVLPRSPSSVASVLALLTGGDALEHIYAHEEDWENSMYSYRLGWGPHGMSSGDGQRFGIWVVRKDTDENTF